VPECVKLPAMLRPLLRRWLPDPDSLRKHRGLRWMGPLLDRPWLWRANRHGIAAGLAAGLFLGLLVPVGQALCACVAVLLLRANLPAAVFATFVSNPLTTPAIVLAGYHVGVFVLGDAGPVADSALDALPLVDRLMAMGEPLLLGLTIMASTSAVLCYLGVTAVWRLPGLVRLLRQRRRRAPREAP
jgi:uncharacterized protein